MKSLERQFIAGLAIVLLAAFSILLWFSVNAVNTLTESHVKTRLEHDAEALLAALWVNPEGEKQLRESRITPIYNQPLSGHYYQFSFPDGQQIRSRSLWDESLPERAVATGETETHREAGPAKQLLLVRTAGYQKMGLNFTLTVAEDLMPLAASVAYFQKFSLSLLVLTTLLIILLQWYVLRRGFRVLDQVRNDVTQVATGHAQLLHEMGPSEIRPLTIEINRLLMQLQQRLKRSRDALGNLAHALKGPISLLMHDIDSLQRVSEPERKALSEKLSRITILIERELKKARLAGKDIGQYFAPARDVPDLISALRQIYLSRDLDIKVSQLPGQSLPFDHEDMIELLGNLLDNACKWAAKHVVLDMQLNDGLIILVADDGPGVDENERSRILKRGTRLDEQENGHGLGLAIVNDLVQDFGGQLSLSTSRELGGLQVRVSLPVPK